MTTEEKLENFYNHSIEIARDEAERLIQTHQTALDQLFSEHQEMKTRQSAAELAAEKEKLKHENNKALSAEQLQIKRTHSLKSRALKDQLFAEVEEKLQAFKKTPDYVSYLCKKTREALALAQDHSIEFYLDASDSNLTDTISRETGVPMLISPESMIGGLQAVIPEKHILIDHSFAAMLQEERDAFTFEGGQLHE